MRGVGVHPHRHQVEAGRGHAALGKEGALDPPGDLELAHGRVADANDVRDPRLYPPRVGAGVDVLGQVGVEKLVQHAARPEELAEVLQRDFALAVLFEGIAVGDGAAAERQHFGLPAGLEDAHGPARDQALALAGELFEPVVHRLGRVAGRHPQAVDRRADVLLHAGGGGAGAAARQRMDVGVEFLDVLLDAVQP